MITGFCGIEDIHNDKMWDYVGCMYPEGFLSSEQTLLFEHEQIENVYYLGLIDEEQEQFIVDLKEIINNNENNNEEER